MTFELDQSGKDFFGEIRPGTNTTITTSVAGDITTYTCVYRTSTGGSSSGGTTRYNVSVEDTDNGSIRVSPSRASRGQTVTITVDPDEGYVLDRLVVRDSDGDRIDLERKSATKYTFEMPRGKVTVEATFVEGEEENVLPFRDVDTDDWSYNAVVYVTDAGIMSGVSETEFAPNAHPHPGHDRPDAVGPGGQAGGELPDDLRRRGRRQLVRRGGALDLQPGLHVRLLRRPPSGPTTP